MSLDGYEHLLTAGAVRTGDQPSPGSVSSPDTPDAPTPPRPLTDLTWRQARAKRLRQLCPPLLEHAKLLQTVTAEQRYTVEGEDVEDRDERHQRALAPSWQAVREVITKVEMEPGTDDIVEAFEAVVTAIDRYHRSLKTNGQFPNTVSGDVLDREAQAIPTAVKALKTTIRTRLQELEQDDADVRLHYARPAATQETVRARLDAVTALDPLPEPREHGHLYVMAIPTSARPGALVPFLDADDAFTHLTSLIGQVIAARPGKGFDPQLSSASRWTRTDEGRAFTSVHPEAQSIYESGMVHGLLDEDGTMTVICGRGTDRLVRGYGDAPREVVIPALLLGMVHDVVGTAGRLADTRTTYQGQWRIAIRIDHLKGVTSSDYYDLLAGAPAYSGDLYERSISTTTAEMVEQPWAIAEELLRRLLRAVGSDKTHLPYRPPQAASSHHSVTATRHEG